MNVLETPSLADRTDPASLELPKVELHIHLDLTASYGAVAALSPEVSLAEYRRDFVGPARCPDLADFLSRTPRFLALQQDERGLRVIVEDLFDQLVRDGVVYAELRFAPLQHTQRSLTAERAVEIVERAMAESIAATGVEARLILCTLRSFGAEDSMRTAQLADAFRGSLVVGLDISGDEAGFPLDAHEPAFRWAAERGIHLTAHAGEACGPASVEETIRRLGASRIGHGVRAAEDPAVVELLKREGVHLEVCPSSNVQTGMYESLAQHPVDLLRRHGVSLSLGTDCRAITDISLAQEYDRVRGAFGWGRAEFDACNRAALEAAFVDDGVRERLLGVLSSHGQQALAAEATARRLDLAPVAPLEQGSGEAPGRRADGSIQTVSGRWIDPLAPRPEDIDIHDIAQALANQCRFGGHSRAFYSVAQHSSLVCDLVLERGASTEAALGALLHDAGEAYLVDLPHPLKHRSELGPPYRRAEARLEQAIVERFGVGGLDPEHKPLDRSLLATERAQFASTDGRWPELDGFPPLNLVIEPWSPMRALQEFMTRYDRLQAARGAAQED